MGRPRKAKPPIIIKCCLCEHFFHSPLIKNNQVNNPRMCVKTGNEIHSVDAACESFQIAPYFFCERTTHQISAKMCHRRVARKFEDCHKCKLRAEVVLASPPEESLKVRAGTERIRSTIDEPCIEFVKKEPPIYLKKRCHITY